MIDEHVQIDTTDRHPAVADVARFFDYEHLDREDLRAVSKLVHDCAAAVLQRVEDCPMLTVGLHKMLEAKDAFVRAAL